MDSKGLINLGSIDCNSLNRIQSHLSADTLPCLIFKVFGMSKLDLTLRLITSESTKGTGVIKRTTDLESCTPCIKPYPSPPLLSNEAIQLLWYFAAL